MLSAGNNYIEVVVVLEGKKSWKEDEYAEEGVVLWERLEVLGV